MKGFQILVLLTVAVLVGSVSVLAESKRMELTDVHARTIVVDAISHDGKSLKAIRVSDKAEVMIPFTLLIPADQERVKELLYAGETFTNGIGMEMIWVPTGKFRMGDLTLNGKADERPVRTVELSGYYMGAAEVTQKQWETVIGSKALTKFQGDDLPVKMVDWSVAMEFCKRLTEREKAAGRLPEGFEYTLPTEAQWEYACRAGTEGDYAGEDLNAMAWFKGNSGGKIHPVGKKKPNAWGFYDMHGNVWEWCLDWYGGYEGLGTTDPTGPASGKDRVIRGGCYGNPPEIYLRSSRRYPYHSTNRKENVGFRVVVVVGGGD